MFICRLSEDGDDDDDDDEMELDDKTGCGAWCLVSFQFQNSKLRPRTSYKLQSALLKYIMRMTMTMTWSTTVGQRYELSTSKLPTH